MKTKTIAGLMLVTVVLITAGVRPAQGVGGSFDVAMEVRRLLEADAATLADPDGPEVAESIVLPVSRGFNQRSTSLCWAYATLNALETIYLVRNPEGPDVELSRRAMQYYTWEDRYRRSIKGVNRYLQEGGVVLDAVRLVQSNGIVAFDDYYDITGPYGYGQANISLMIAGAESVTDKMVALYNGLDIVYTAPSALTHMPGTPTVDEPNLAYVEATPGQLAEFVLAGQVWQSYTPSEAEVGFHDHPDSDARWENLSWHMPRSEFPGRIKQALEAGFPVVVSVQNHGILVYGADYDSDGVPLAYYIKDSYDSLHVIGGNLYWGYFYVAEAENLHAMLWEMTTVKL